MTGTALSQNPKILAYEGNPASYVLVDGNNNMSNVLIGKKSWFGSGSGPGSDSRGPIPETLVK